MESIIMARLNYEDKDKFMKKCKEKGDNASELIRSWIQSYLTSEVKEPINKVE
jgi:hypothetical protein